MVDTAQVEAGAKALAWSTLSEQGRQTCDWERDFSQEERTQFRSQATIVLDAAAEVELPLRHNGWQVL